MALVAGSLSVAGVCAAVCVPLTGLLLHCTAGVVHGLTESRIMYDVINISIVVLAILLLL